MLWWPQDIHHTDDVLISLNLCVSALIENSFADCIADAMFSAFTPTARDIPVKKRQFLI